MIIHLAVAALTLRMAIANLQESSTTRTSTTIPMAPVVATSKSELNVAPTISDGPSTYYASARTTGSLQDYKNTGSITAPVPGLPITSGASDYAANSSSSLPGIVYTEKTQGSLNASTSHLPPTFLPSPIALSKYSTIAKPTLPSTFHLTPTALSSPIALSSYPAVASPTLPSISESPIALSEQLSVAAPTLPTAGPQITETYVPAIVHTEMPAESLELPPSQTHINPGHETTLPDGFMPGANDGTGNPPSQTNVSPGHETNQPSRPGADTGDMEPEIVTVPTTIVTVAPGMMITMGGYQSTVTRAESRQSVVTAIPSQVMTMSGGEVVTVPAAVYTLPVIPVSATSSSMTTTISGDSGSEPSDTAPHGGGDGSIDVEDEQSAAVEVNVGSWMLSLLGIAVGAIALM